jgi:hypothetical protein
MPTYRNIRTGVIVEVKSKVEGEWELVSSPSVSEKTETTVKKTVKKTKKEV